MDRRGRLLQLGAILSTVYLFGHASYMVWNISLREILDDSYFIGIFLAVATAVFWIEKSSRVETHTPGVVANPRRSAALAHYLRLARATVCACLIAGCVFASRLIGWRTTNGLLVLAMALGVVFLYVALTLNRRIGFLGAALFGLLPALVMLWNSGSAN